MNSYLLLKACHVFAAMVFLGNLIVTGWWKMTGLRSGDPTIIAFTQRESIRADSILSGASLLVLFGTGFTNAWFHFNYHGDFWLFYGSLVFVGTLVLSLAILVPLERRQRQLAATLTKDSGIPEKYRRLIRAELSVRVLVVFICLCMLYLMVYKPVAIPLG